MTYADETKLYHESEWAAQRWDWFNEGQIVEPKSFCQFWRTVLLYATVAYFFRPVERLLVSIPTFPRVPTPSVLGRVIPAMSRGGWFMLRTGGRFLRLAVYPLIRFTTLPFRLLARTAGSPTLVAAVKAGRKLDAFGQQHRKGFQIFAVGILVLYGSIMATFLILVTFFQSWFWTLIGIGSLVGVGFAVYGFIRSGATGLILDGLDLLSEAAIAAKHGVCPPVRILRSAFKRDSS